MGSYAQAYTITTPERALNPHWTIPSLLYAIAESLLQVGYCVLAFSWYSAISSKNRIVPDAIKKMRRPVIIVSIVSQIWFLGSASKLLYSFTRNVGYW